MQVSALKDIFKVTRYRPSGQSAMLELVDGNIMVRSQYRFLNDMGRQQGPIIMLDMVVTQKQSNDLKTILGDVLQTTNAEIELRTGWTKYIEEVQ